jgi:hypothetical protein
VLYGPAAVGGADGEGGSGDPVRGDHADLQVVDLVEEVGDLGGVFGGFLFAAAELGGCSGEDGFS